MSHENKSLQDELTDASFYQGIAFGRAFTVFDAEEIFAKSALRYKGYLALSDAFKCYFLETVDLLNTAVSQPTCHSFPEHYFHASVFVRLTRCFQTLCASERIALRGYPFEGYTLLRNIYDTLVILSAAAQGLTDFYSIDGIIPNEGFDPKRSKALRKKTEYAVQRLMTGEDSALPDWVRFELRRLDDMYDWETHGGRLSMSTGIGWMQGSEPMSVLPEFREDNLALFINRYTEVAWMAHRLIPLVRGKNVELDNAWHDKWRLIDRGFYIHVESLTSQNGKPIGAAAVEFVGAKFPFDSGSRLVY